MAEAFQGLVIKVDMGDFNFILRKAVCINNKAMVLGCDFHRPGGQVPDRMIGPVVAEFQFACLGPQRQPQNLMAQADAEYGLFAQQGLDRIDGIGNRFGIAGAVGKKYTVRMPPQHLLGAGAGRKHPQVTTMQEQSP